jgi:hypothetical protein
VVDPHEVEDGGVDLVKVHGVLDDVVAEVVGFPKGEAAFDAAAGHPHREAARVMVASVVGLGEGAL